MNFLAHLYLAAPTDELLVGNLMGDFVKGRPESLVGKFPDEVILGIRQHRAIDVFTDSHPTFCQAKSLLAPHRRRLAGIVVDIFYDYFLSRNWPGEHQARLEFIRHCHNVLLARGEWLPAHFRKILPRIISEKWLESYATVEGIALTFRRVAARAPVAAGVLGAEEDLLENEEQFSKLFAEFFPELVEFSETWNTKQ